MVRGRTRRPFCRPAPTRHQVVRCLPALQHLIILCHSQGFTGSEEGKGERVEGKGIIQTLSGKKSLIIFLCLQGASGIWRPRWAQKRKGEVTTRTNMVMFLIPRLWSFPFLFPLPSMQIFVTFAYFFLITFFLPITFVFSSLSQHNSLTSAHLLFDRFWVVRFIYFQQQTPSLKICFIDLKWKKCRQ